MSRHIHQGESSGTAAASHLKKVAVAAAAGALLDKRTRVAGALMLAGMAWMSARKSGADTGDDGAGVHTQDDRNERERLDTESSHPASVSDSLPELCPPSSPFLDVEDEETRLEKIREALLPPASLFTHPAPGQQPLIPAEPPTPSPKSIPAPVRPPELRASASTLLKSAPVFIEVEESAAPVGGTPAAARSAAVLPDTITIPTTPDPPPAMLADAQAAQSQIQSQGKTESPASAAIPPKPAAASASESAQSPQPPNPPSAPTPDTEPSPPPTKRRRSFLEWLREP